MNDPAVDAAHRAMKACYNYPSPNGDLIHAAREALKPIREWYEGFSDRMPELERLIYSSDELDRD